MVEQASRSLSLAFAALEAGDTKKARECLTFARTVGNESQSLHADAFLSYLNGDWEKSVRAFLLLLSDGQLREEGMALLLRALRMLGNTELLTKLGETLATHPTLSEGLLIELLDCMLAAGNELLREVFQRKLLTVIQPHRKSILTKAAYWAKQLGNKDVFYAFYRQLSKEVQAERLSRLKQFEVEVEHGSRDAAEQILNDLLKTAPSDDDVQAYMARFLLDQQRIREAANFVGPIRIESVSNNPFFLESYLGILTASEQYERAISEAQTLTGVGSPLVRYLSLRTIAESEYKLGNYNKAFAIRPKLTELDTELGYDSDTFWATVASNANREDLATTLFEKILQRNRPADRYEYSLHLLRLKRYDEAWSHYKYRFDALPNLKKYSSYTEVERLAGEYNLHQRVLHVFPEQGLGDQLLFFRYLPAIKQKFLAVKLHVEERLVEILRLCPDLDPIQIDGVLTPPHLGTDDFTLPVGDLPRLAQILTGSTSPPAPLCADIARLALVKASYSKPDATSPETGQTMKLIGVAWRGASNMNSRLKSINLNDLNEVLQNTTGFLYLNCNYLAETARDVVQSNQLDRFLAVETVDEGDLVGVLLRLSQCDMIISTSQTYIHFSALLRKPTLLLLPNPTAELWYWRDTDNNSDGHAWYPDQVEPLRFNLKTDGFPSDKVCNWIKKTGARGAGFHNQ